MSTPIPGKVPAHPAFEPSPAQRRLLDYITAHPEFKTVTQYCAAADVPRSSYERWCREPGFRAWFIREWVSALMFEGWHVLTLARAHMVNSPVHFKAIFGLLFTPAGQSALAAWAEHCARAPQDPSWPTPPESVPASGFPQTSVQNQQPAAENEHYSPPGKPAPQPSSAACGSRRQSPPQSTPSAMPSVVSTPGRADPTPTPSAPGASLPQSPQQDQPLTSKNEHKPSGPSEQLLRSLRNAILGLRDP